MRAVKALKEIGLLKAVKFSVFTALELLLSVCVAPNLRALLLRLLGAEIASGAVLMRVRFFNLYRGGFPVLSVGRDCFVGDETMLDLAEAVTFEDQATLAERVLVLTHMNVGYADHPLQKKFPPAAKPVRFGRGCFVGAGAVVLAGVAIGEEAFVAAGSVVTEDVAPRTLVAGAPARLVRSLS